MLTGVAGRLMLQSEYTPGDPGKFSAWPGLRKHYVESVARQFAIFEVSNPDPKKKDGDKLYHVLASDTRPETGIDYSVLPESAARPHEVGIILRQAVWGLDAIIPREHGTHAAGLVDLEGKTSVLTEHTRWELDEVMAKIEQGRE